MFGFVPHTEFEQLLDHWKHERVPACLLRPEECSILKRFIVRDNRLIRLRRKELFWAVLKLLVVVLAIATCGFFATQYLRANGSQGVKGWDYYLSFPMFIYYAVIGAASVFTFRFCTVLWESKITAKREELLYRAYEDAEDEFAPEINKMFAVLVKNASEHGGVKVSSLTPRGIVNSSAEHYFGAEGRVLVDLQVELEEVASTSGDITLLRQRVLSLERQIKDEIKLYQDRGFLPGPWDRFFQRAA
jgi:hypothetical protein